MWHARRAERKSPERRSRNPTPQQGRWLDCKGGFARELKESRRSAGSVLFASPVVPAAFARLPQTFMSHHWRERFRLWSRKSHPQSSAAQIRTRESSCDVRRRTAERTTGGSIRSRASSSSVPPIDNRPRSFQNCPPGKCGRDLRIEDVDGINRWSASIHE